MAGKSTVKIAKKLQEMLPGPYEVFYDHGVKSERNVCECKATIDQELSRLTAIAGIDIAVLREDKVILLIEIEEKKTLSPKVFFGDYVTMQMVNHVFIDKKRYDVTPLTRFVIGGLAEAKGSSKSKLANLEEELAAKMQKPRQIDLIVKDHASDLTKAVIDATATLL